MKYWAFLTGSGNVFVHQGLGETKFTILEKGKVITHVDSAFVSAFLKRDGDTIPISSIILSSDEIENNYN